MDVVEMSTKPSGLRAHNLGLYGQLVIGPPGSGKTTYCSAMYNFLTQLGRKVAVINLDPANENFPYPCSINLADLIRLDDVMDYLGLGPNGGLVYCMNYLYENREWLTNELVKLKEKEPRIYLIFDLPGQVELYTHYPSMFKLINFMTRKSFNATCEKSLETASKQFDLETASKQPDQIESLPSSSSSSECTEIGLDLHLTSVHLVDSHYCSDVAKFIACLLTSLNAMLQFGMPHVNILSKADLVEQYGELDFNLDFFTEVLDLNYLVDRMCDPESDPFHKKYEKFTRKLANLIQDSALVQFLLLDVRNESHLERVMRYVDRANGYVFGPEEQQHSLQNLMHYASGVEPESNWTGLVQEQYMS